MKSLVEPEILRYAAFAAAEGGGNPAGIVLDAAELSDAEMLRIAARVGYPETAFVTSISTELRGLIVGIRYWSPAAEVPFCGHATVATAVALAERYSIESIVFDTEVGEVSLAVENTDDGVRVSFTSVQPHVRAMPSDVTDRVLDLLGLRAGDLHPDFPAREAFAGNWHPMLVLRDAEIFNQFRFAPAPVAEMMRERGWAGTITVLHPVAEDEFVARNIFPVGRINEDPATGSAAAATGAYLREIGRVPPSRAVHHIHQGAHVGRPSLLEVSIPEHNGIVVSGTAKLILHE